jgi:hypothetical protein
VITPETCESWLASDSGQPSNAHVECETRFASTLAPTGFFTSTAVPENHGTADGI